MAEKEKEAKAGTTEWTIWVNLPNSDAKDFQLASSAYVSKLFAAIREYLKFLNLQVPLELVVQTKDAADNPLLLNNAKLTLAEALRNSKCNSKGEYDVYVEAQSKDEVAGSARETVRARLWIGSDLSIRQIECKSFEQMRSDIIEEFQLFWSPSVKLYFIPGNDPKAILNKIKIQDDTTLREYLKHTRPRPPILIFHGKSHTESPTAPFSDSESNGSRADSTRSETNQALFSQAVRERDGCCLACGSAENLEAAHVYPWELRKSLSKSMAAQELGHVFESNNGITLCHVCHYLFDQGHWHVKDGLFLVSPSILGSDCKVAKVNGQKFPAFFRKQPVTQDTVLPGERRWPGPCTWAAREKEVYEEKRKKRKEWHDQAKVHCDVCYEPFKTKGKKYENHLASCQGSVIHYFTPNKMGKLPLSIDEKEEGSPLPDMTKKPNKNKKGKK